jgi:transcriptional regulator with XRE-family HTH domain
LPGNKLSKWESGKVQKAPSVDVRIALAKLYEVTLTELGDNEALSEWHSKADLLAGTPAWDYQAA